MVNIQLSDTLLNLKKLKPLDWFFTVVLVSILLFLISTSLNQDKWIKIEFKVINSPTYFPNNGGGDAPFWVADKIRIGDVQFDNFGKKNLEILNIRKWGYQNKEMWITASVKAKYKAKQKKYTFLYQPLEIGRTIDVTINGSNIHGIVSGIDGISDTRRIFTVTIKARLIDTWSSYSAYTRGVEPWIANAVEKNAEIKDPSGKIIAKILDVDVRPAERVVSTTDGRTNVTEDPLKKDVFLTLQLGVTKQDDTYMFLEDKPIIIGWSIPIYLNNVAIYPIITDILK